MTRKRTSWSASTALAALLLAGCGERGPRIVVFANTEPPVVAEVVVSPAQTTLFALGDTVRFTATSLDSLGAVIEGVTVVWASNDVAIASITSDGLALARGQGQAIITATAEDVVGRAFLAVSLQNAANSASLPHEVVFGPDLDQPVLGEVAVPLELR